MEVGMVQICGMGPLTATPEVGGGGGFKRMPR